MTIPRVAQNGRFRPLDLAMFERFGISEALLSRHGWRRVADPEARDVLNQQQHKGDLAGILIPFLDPTAGHQVACQLRRDNPEIEGGKPKAKYLSSYGDQPHIYFTSNASDMLADVSITVVLVEAPKSALTFMAAATRLDRDILVIALGGCWGWRTSRAGKTTGPNGERVDEAGPQPDLNRVSWTDRNVVILLDSNAATNPKVRAARRRLAEEVQSRGAKVRIGTVPAEPDVNGPDDFRAAHDDEALLELVDGAVPVQPLTVEDVLVDCGFLTLTEPVDLNSLEAALRELAGVLRSADPIRRQTTRAAVIARLKTLKMDGGAGLVDAAIGNLSDEPTAADLPFLADIPPWPDPVEGAKVLDAAVAVFTKYMVLPAHAAHAIALWTVHAYLMAVWGTSPILAVLSPMKRCGKSTLLELLEALAPRALLISNVTTASLFRAVEKFHPTLLADEADTWLSDDTSELRGIFNSGWRRGTARVLRCSGDEQEPTLFSTWAPKAIAAIVGVHKLPGTIEDRSIIIELRRKTADERVSRFRHDKVKDEAAALRSQLQRWADDHAADVARLDPDIPTSLNDRAMDNWRPLVAIADAAGGHWPSRARAAALALCGNESAEDLGAELLADTRTVFEDAGNPAVMTSADLLKSLVEMEDRPWAEWSKGKPMTGSKLARMLRPFKVAAGGKIRVGAKVARSYRREAFADAWTRYLPEIPGFNAEQRNNPNESGPEPAIPKRNTNEECSTLKSEENPMNTRVCSTVPLSNPDSGAGEDKEDTDGTF